jgi:antitoxin
MKYNFGFDVITFKSGKKDLIINIEKKVELVATFLMSDVQGYSFYAIEALDKVLCGGSEYEELNGNVCGVEIRKEKTTVYDNLAEDGMGNWCEIETKELRDLVGIWTNRLKKFREENP